MKIWTAHERAHASPILVREGFSFGALLFGPIWHRLIAMRGPVPESYSRRLVESVLKALAPG